MYQDVFGQKYSLGHLAAEALKVSMLDIVFGSGDWWVTSDPLGTLAVGHVVLV